MTGGANVAPGSPSASGTRGSGPASTDSSSARSSTLRAIGPEIPSASHWFSDGHAGTRPRLGRSPYTPQNDAGLRRLPPMSEPSASGTMPEASAHAAPPLDPPALRVGSTGLRVVPKIVLNVWLPAANSGHVRLPDRHRPRPPDPLDDQLVAVGDVVGQQRRAVRRQPPGHVVGVLERPRQPVQRPALVVRRPVGLARPVAGALLVEGDDRVQLGVALGDTGEVEVHQLRAGDLAAAQRRQHLPGGRVDGQVGHLPDFGVVPAPLSALQRPRTSGIPGRPGIPSAASPPPPEQGAGDDAEQHEAGTDGDALDEVRLRGDGRGRGRGEDLAGHGGGVRGRRPPERRPGCRRAPCRRCRRTRRPSASRPRSASAGRRRRSSRRRPRRRPR